MTHDKLALLAIVLATSAAYAASDDPDDDIEEIVVTGDLDSLPGDEIRSVFGFPIDASVVVARS